MPSRGTGGMHDLKAQQRAQFLAPLRGMPRSAVVELGREIAEHVIRSPFFETAGAPLPYSAVATELGGLSCTEACYPRMPDRPD